MACKNDAYRQSTGHQYTRGCASSSGCKDSGHTSIFSHNSIGSSKSEQSGSASLLNDFFIACPSKMKRVSVKKKIICVRACDEVLTPG